MDLRSPVAYTITSVMDSGVPGTSNAALVAVSDSTWCGSGGILGLSMSTTCGAACPSTSTPGISTFTSSYSSGS